MNKHSVYPHGPGQRKKSLTAQDWLGIVLIIAVVTGAAGLGYWYYTAKKNHVVYDQNTFCPEGGPFAKTVLLIDLTDEISFIQEQKLKTFVQSLADPSNPDAVPQHAMLSVYLLQESDASGLPVPVVELCNPGSGQGLNELTSAPQLANKRFSERFLTPINAAIGNIVHTDSAKTSPIIESIRGIAVSAFAAKPREGYVHRLIVISDMLQNSAATSHLRQGQDIDKVDKNKLRADLVNVSRVDIKVINRNTSARLQGKALVEYWRGYFRASGSSLESAERWTE